MAGKSAIEWTEHTWNPIVGCSIVSPGCARCYAMKLAARLQLMGTAPHYAGTTEKSKTGAVWTGKIAQAPEHVLLEPLHRKKPTTYFVNSMGDLFHENITDEQIDRVFAVMALAYWHTYQVLTKRAERQRSYCSDPETPERIDRAMDEIAGGCCDNDATLGDYGWPLPNVWLGVSTERQLEADERIPLLLRTPAAIRFISAEPLLGPIDIKSITILGCDRVYPLAGYMEHHPRGTLSHPKLDWVIVGGESGPGSRPMHPDWARSLRDQCSTAGVPFFFKQWGSWFPLIDRDNDDPDWRRDYTVKHRLPRKFQIINVAGGQGFHGERVHLMQRLGKSRSGRVLDGIEHNGLPAITNAEAA